MTSRTQMVLHERVNGVMYGNKFYPFKIANFTVSGEKLTPVSTVRYYLHSVSMTISNGGVHGASSIEISGFIQEVSQILAQVHIPALTQATDFSVTSKDVRLGILLDLGKSVEVSIPVADTIARATVVYAEIDDV